jgi:hypothetical protein
VITESDRSAGAEVVPRDTRSDTAGDDPRCTCGQIAEKRNSREIGAELASVRLRALCCLPAPRTYGPVTLLTGLLV